MRLDPDFVADQKEKAIHKWTWHRPWLATALAFIHPLGMLYTSVPAFIVYLVAWGWMVFRWESRPTGTGVVLAAGFAAYAYYETVFRNAAIEKWKYGLVGTGHENPKGLPALIEADDQHT